LESVAPPLVQNIHSPMGSIAPQQSEPGVTLPLLDGQGEVRPLEELEAEVIRFAIAHYRGQMSEVARRLQIGRSTLYRKLDALGLAQRLTENDTDPVVAG
jgi:DNA-binding NtrC family response regulator